MSMVEQGKEIVRQAVLILFGVIGIVLVVYLFDAWSRWKEIGRRNRI